MNAKEQRAAGFRIIVGLGRIERIDAKTCKLELTDRGLEKVAGVAKLMPGQGLRWVTDVASAYKLGRCVQVTHSGLLVDFC